MSGLRTVVAFASSPAGKAVVRKALSSQGISSLRSVKWEVDEDAGQACIKATQLAIELASKGRSVLVVGSRSALVPDALNNHIDADAWHGAWVFVMQSHSIAFALVSDEGKTAPSPKPSRAHQDALRVLRAAMHAPAGSRAYICGRPPYGYRVVDGKLVPEPQQQEAVKLAFKMADRGCSLPKIVEALQHKHGRGSDGKSQFWDRVKLRRIWSHVRLYTKGEYATTGQVVRIPDLAFMDEAYALVAYPTPPGRAAAAMAAVPSPSGKGRMVASAAPTNRSKS